MPPWPKLLPATPAPPPTTGPQPAAPPAAPVGVAARGAAAAARVRVRRAVAWHWAVRVGVALQRAFNAVLLLVGRSARGHQSPATPTTQPKLTPALPRLSLTPERSWAAGWRRGGGAASSLRAGPTCPSPPPAEGMGICAAERLLCNQHAPHRHPLLVPSLPASRALAARLPPFANNGCRQASPLYPRVTLPFCTHVSCRL